MDGTSDSAVIAWSDRVPSASTKAMTGGVILSEAKHALSLAEGNALSVAEGSLHLAHRNQLIEVPEALWLAAALAVPLALNPWGHNDSEPESMRISFARVFPPELVYCQGRHLAMILRTTCRWTLPGESLPGAGTRCGVELGLAGGRTKE
jgi:hypothetical protein